MKSLIVVVAMLVTCMLSPVAIAVGAITEIVIHDRAQNRALPVYLHEGRHYVVGHPGNEYEIRLRNRQRSDILAVVSVDGVDVITGDTADWQHSGYVLGSQQSFGIKGWRKNLERTAAFYFTALPDSYAARTGRPEHVGVIGIAVFRKKPEPLMQYSPPRLAGRAADADAPAPATGAAERSAGSASDDFAGPGNGSRAEAPATTARKSARLGTGHGRSETSVVTYTEFERATTAPAEIITIYYDSYHNLVAQGIIRAPSLTRPAPFPVPFPGRFAPDPR
ncbi:MAG: hypothetical protein Q8L95_10205 [Burkholderiales bacterium]|nr:hypothetical protein [Burkholderiales bacterium]